MAESMPPDSEDSLLEDDYYALLNLGKNVIHSPVIVIKLLKFLHDCICMLKYTYLIHAINSIVFEQFFLCYFKFKKYNFINFHLYLMCGFI